MVVSDKNPFPTESWLDFIYWVGSEPKIQKVSKTQILPPFRDENELRKVVTVCHDRIWAKEGHDPAKAFDELTKLLFLKLYDERESVRYYEFVIIAGERPVDTAVRIRRLFDKAKVSSRYKDIFESKFSKSENVSLELDDYTIHTCIQVLQGYSLIATTDNIIGADIKGTVFEEMVGGTFRGELGQFFTPRTIAEFMVKMLNPSHEDRILDPACGSGGFLIMAIRHISDKIKTEMPNLNETQRSQLIKDFSMKSIFGTDINDRIARVAKMNMIMHGDGHSGIYNINGLFVDSEDNSEANREIKEGTFSIIFSNPPFAGYEKEEGTLGKFDLGKSSKGKPRSVTKEILFIERIIKLLKNGGRAALVLPQGIYSDKALKYARDYIKKHCKILALIAIPIWAFRPSGTGVRGSLLFIEKCDMVPEDYKIYIRKVEHIGYDSTGKHDKNDLEDICKDFLKPPKDYIVRFSDLDKCFGYSDTGRIDPKFFIKETRDKLAVFEKTNYNLIRLDKIATFLREGYNPKKEAEKLFLYIEVNDVNIRTGQIKRRFRRGKDITQNTLVIHEGDLIVSRRWPDRGAIAIVPKECDGGLIVSEFSVLKVNEDIVNKMYIYELFRTRHMLDLMDVYTSGEMSHRISEEDLKSIRIPVPDKTSIQETIIDEMKILRNEAKNFEEKAEQLRKNAQLKLLKKLNLPEAEERHGQTERVTYNRIKYSDDV